MGNPGGQGSRSIRTQRGVATPLRKRGCWAAPQHRHPLWVLGKEHVQISFGAKKAAVKSNQGGGIKGTLAEEVMLHLGPCRMSRSLPDVRVGAGVKKGQKEVKACKDPRRHKQA